MDSKTPASQQITAWLTDWRRGDREAPEHLFAVVYPELRRIAARFLHNERNHHTLEPNALVNELCVRLLGSEPLAYQDRAHFFAMAAQSMRRILHARARIAEKRGGERERVTLTAVEGWNPVATMRTFCFGPSSDEVRQGRSPRSPRRRIAILRGASGNRDRRGVGRFDHHGEARLEGGARLADGSAGSTLN